MTYADAVLICVGRMGVSEEEHDLLERRMLEAVRDAEAEGVTDPDDLRDRIRKAREA